MEEIKLKFAKSQAAVKRFEQKVAILSQRLNVNPRSRKRRIIERKLGLNTLKLKLEKLSCEGMKALVLMDALETKVKARKRAQWKHETLADLSFYVRCLHSYVADKMDVWWPDLASYLREERAGMRLGKWWGKRYHGELLGYLEPLGISKELWHSSLWLSVEDDFYMPRSFLSEMTRFVSADQLRKDKETLASVETLQILGPTSVGMFTKLVEEYEKHKFLA